MALLSRTMHLQTSANLNHLLLICLYPMIVWSSNFQKQKLVISIVFLRFKNNQQIILDLVLMDKIILNYKHNQHLNNRIILVQIRIISLSFQIIRTIKANFSLINKIKISSSLLNKIKVRPQLGLAKCSHKITRGHLTLGKINKINKITMMMMIIYLNDCLFIF